ncbi:MAG: hypothetical protein WDN27_00450 [Candidatus Saccharibacteria bacterium]
MKDKKAAKQQLNVSDLPALAKGALQKVSGYKVFVFFLVVAGIYGYILWRINVYSNAPASASEETAQSTPQPRIDPATIQKIQSLQDNSVSVQSLFQSARNNPFQE